MIEMVKAPKYACDVSNDVPLQPERFREGSMIAWAYCICDGSDRCGADAGMWWKGYGNQKTLIFQRDELGGMGGMKSCGCGEHWRTLENVQDEILCNSISPLGLNPEVHAENFLYIRQRQLRLDFNKILLYSLLSSTRNTTITMSSITKPSPTELCQQAEESRRNREAHKKEEREKEVALLWVVEEEEEREAERKQQEEEQKCQRAEAALEAE